MAIGREGKNQKLKIESMPYVETMFGDKNRGHANMQKY